MVAGAITGCPTAASMASIRCRHPSLSQLSLRQLAMPLTITTVASPSKIHSWAFTHP